MKPSTLSESIEQQIEYLKQMLTQYDFEVSVTTENFKPGKRVEIIAGPMVGLQGELIEHRGNNKFILRFEHINSILTHARYRKIIISPN